MKYLMPAAVAALAFAHAVKAEDANSLLGLPKSEALTISGEIIATYGNTTYSGKPWTEIMTLKAEGKRDLEGATFHYKGSLYLRSDHHELPIDVNDIADVELSLDLHEWGEFGYSTYTRCTGMGFPWTDGDVGNLGSVNIHPWVPGTWRCVGGTVVILAAGPTSVNAADYFFYHNDIGPLRVEAYYDPDLRYGDYSGADTKTLEGDPAPKFEGFLSYSLTSAISGRLGFTNLGDYSLGATVKVPEIDMEFNYDRQYMAASTPVVGHIINATWKPDWIPYFKSASFTYFAAEGDTNFILDLHFGTEKLALGVAMDGQHNYAAEMEYHVTPSVSLLAGWDSGFKLGDGWSGAYAPSTSVPARGDSYEIGMKVTF